MPSLQRFALPIAFILVAAAACPAKASVTYHYQGRNFDYFLLDALPDRSGERFLYDESMFISGSFSLASPLGPNLLDEEITDLVLDFSFADGVNTIDIDDPTVAGFSFRGFRTDAYGQILEWWIELSSLSEEEGAVGILSRYATPSALDQATVGSGRFIIFDIAETSNNPGSWTVVPEASTAPLLALGLALLSLVARRGSC